MEATQLELNLQDLSPQELKMHQMQAQIDAACDSMGKVRRKLFAEWGETKKEIAALRLEKAELREKLSAPSKKTEWIYGHGEHLFALPCTTDICFEPPMAS
jgi:regulator of replication initiation timing